MKFLACLVLSLLLLPASSGAAPGDDRFLAAREAFRTGDRTRLDAQLEEARLALARGEPGELDVWIEYWRLRQGIEDAGEEAIADFLARQKDSWPAERLRGDWLKLQGKKQQWSAFSRDYEKLRQPDTELQCYALQATLGTAREAASLDTARHLWLGVLDLPELFPTDESASGAWPAWYG